MRKNIINKLAPCAALGLAAGLLAVPNQTWAAGDDCASATVIASLPFSETADNTTAPNQVGVSCADDGTGFFWSFTPATTQAYTISGVGGPDAVLAVIEGGCAGTQIACVDAVFFAPGETLTTTLSAGTEYIIVYGGWGASDVGEFTLTVDVAPIPPANDTCVGPYQNPPVSGPDPACFLAPSRCGARRAFSVLRAGPDDVPAALS